MKVCHPQESTICTKVIHSSIIIIYFYISKGIHVLICLFESLTSVRSLILLLCSADLTQVNFSTNKEHDIINKSDTFHANRGIKMIKDHSKTVRTLKLEGMHFQEMEGKSRGDICSACVGENFRSKRL